MIKKTKSLACIIILSLVTLCSYAQNLTREGVLNVNIRSAGPIIQNGAVKGYYMFYRTDKKNSKTSNYLLSIYDENLRELNAVTIVRPNSYALVEAAFNGEAFGFLFFDTRQKLVEIVSYDKTLQPNGNITRKVSNRLLLASLQNVALGQDADQAFLVPVSDRGFLYYGLKANNKMHYEIESFDNKLKSLWVQRASEKAKKFQESATEAFQSTAYVGSVVITKGMQSNDMDTDIMVHEIATGKELFRVPLETAEHSVSFSDVYFDEAKSTVTVFGEYFKKSAKEMSARSLGFITLVYDMTGNIIQTKINSWENEISKAAPVNEKGKFDGNNTSILFHNIVRDGQGNTFVIGEQYKKAASAAGIALNVMLGGGAANVQLNVYNMVVFEFTPDYNIKKVHVFEKDKNVLQLPAGYGNLSPRALSYYARAVGGFDYLFTQKSEDQSMFTFSYLNYDKERGEKGKNVLGTVIYTPEKVFTVDKQNLNRKSTNYFVYKAKEGYVLIMEYDKKAKKLESRLEKVNY